MTDTTPEHPDVGTLAIDHRCGRLGVVMGRTGPYVQLRPEGGGKEWDVPVGDVRSATTNDVLHLRVREINKLSESRW
ncbi:hypothetical protein [Streptomyces alkaliterrae]|uniref:Uncharacterized protein n=1 Tax=Streptomyces alkaliterrae TaxID=2213162 RepID=A0A5P0YVQ4_9ACTN|nr:hypothetical protein [Streptomyces alkaliterrae]MBB1256243.1 hypothetical protein [Streptomyces alkaliterrae]MBB1261204.1 hypothetical protein [Streptomyces alkaliterrae]MQS04374.1 hypothetical protein [Streptomyces alkaliterrae]